MDGRIWGIANERNAIVTLTARNDVREVFCNFPDPTTRLRNAGPLEFPASPFLPGRKLCIAHTDVSKARQCPQRQR